MGILALCRIVLVIAAGLLISSCATQAPPYPMSIDNVEALKRFPSSMAVGAFTVQANTIGAATVGLRGSSMVSPVGDNYASYLADALRRELMLAGKLDPNSKLEISGVLIKNDIAAGGSSTNSGEIEARFIVKREGLQRFAKVKRAEMIWESSFAGGIAVPKAVRQYPLIVQKLLAELLADADFQSAVK